MHYNKKCYFFFFKLRLYFNSVELNLFKIIIHSNVRCKYIYLFNFDSRIFDDILAIHNFLGKLFF